MTATICAPPPFAAAAESPLSRRLRDLVLPFFLKQGVRTLRKSYEYRVDWGPAPPRRG
jgi:hypothetical protein